LAVTVHVNNLTLDGKIYNNGDIITNPSAEAIRTARAGTTYGGVQILTESGDVSQHDTILFNDVAGKLKIDSNRLAELLKSKVDSAAITDGSIAEVDLATAVQPSLLKKAMSGDMVFVISPTTCGSSAAAMAAGGTRTVTITLKTAAGEVHSWYNGDLSVSIADTSTAGTASIVDTTPAMVNGVCSVVVTYDAAAWAAGETTTLTVNNQTIMGYTVTGGTSVDTLVA
jgi:hypothetical protein